ncbi:AGAP008808-PA-like protein [Anopheles sinensis]|uniref:AGAP008808-PA-like protein n=1 Tax=Anopheles sinensis TaxID=74873 RepID=A0A084W604_ANOSI|nr:AGAP008808-PA-like protein [Anopheles sinensis]
MCVQFRPTGVFLITVLTFCVVNPICGQHEQNECGKRQLIIGNRIHGGEETKLDLWPWHAAIFVKIETKCRYTCGGSIISPEAILTSKRPKHVTWNTFISATFPISSFTAAHCLFLFTHLVSVDEIFVHVGRENLTDLTTNVQIKNVSEIIVHPEFRLYYFDNDIAILRLTSDIEMTQFVQPICLWDNNENPSAGDSGTVVGFGFNEKNEVSEILQEATLTVVDGLECLELDRHAYGPVLTSKMFCAGGRPGVSACKGDSGGGMFFTRNGTWYISGIIAFIPKRYDATCDSTKYTVFTKVSKYHQWILGAMNTRRYSKDLEPCKDNFVASKTMCNAANKFDHSFLLVGRRDGILRVPMNGYDGNDVDIITGDNIASLDHDCSKGRVYWLTNRRSEIWSAKYDGTDKKLFIREDRNSFVIAVDWISRRLYYCDYEKNAIHVASLDNPDLQ